MIVSISDTRYHRVKVSIAGFCKGVGENVSDRAVLDDPQSCIHEIQLEISQQAYLGVEKMLPSFSSAAGCFKKFRSTLSNLLKLFV